MYLQLFAFTTDDELLKVLEYLVEQKTRTDCLAGDNKKTRSVYQYQHLSEIEVEAIKSSIKNITEVHSMTKSELSIYLKTNHSRYCTLENKSGDDRALCQIEEALFNSICSPQIIKIIKDEFLRRCNGDT